jgi:hypothetical protein
MTEPRSQNDIEEMNNATAMQRIATLEARCRILEKAMHAAFGKAWMEQVMDDVTRDMSDEPAVE